MTEDSLAHKVEVVQKMGEGIMYISGVIEQHREKIIRQSLLSDEFLDFVKRNNIPFETLLSYYRCAIMEVETKFKVLNEQYALRYDRNPIESIKSRVKSYESLLKKIRKKNIPLTLEAIEEQIWDVAGIRVICSFQDDIYLLADCLLQQDDITLIEVKDYIKNPKPNGYRSLHLIIEIPIFLQDEKRNVKVEVQLRTIAMDSWASLEHKLKYKKNLPDGQIEEISKELKTCADMSAELDDRMQAVRRSIYKDGNPKKYEEIPFSESRIPLVSKNTLAGLLTEGAE